MALKNLFKKKEKNGKKLAVLLMNCAGSNGLQDIIDTMKEQGKHYAIQNVRTNFIRLLYNKYAKAYGAENITGLFPDQWEAPQYRQTNANMNGIVVGCVRDYIRSEMSFMDADAVEIHVDPFADRGFAAAWFEFEPISPD